MSGIVKLAAIILAGMVLQTGSAAAFDPCFGSRPRQVDLNTVPSDERAAAEQLRAEQQNRYDACLAAAERVRPTRRDQGDR